MKNPKTSRQAFFKSAQRDVFCFVFYFQFFFITFEKIQGIVFSTMYILAYKYPSATNRYQKMTKWPSFLYGKTCCLGKTIKYIYSKNVINFEI